MSKPHMGARVRYCGHAGWFIADIWEVAGANVVIASRAVSPDMLTRNDVATHHLVDFPIAGYWNPTRGLFVVPSEQVRDLRRGEDH